MFFALDDDALREEANLQHKAIEDMTNKEL
jgi:hypothetical protein